MPPHPAAAAAQAVPPDSLVAWFDRAWGFADTTFFDSATVANRFTEENRLRLRRQAATLGSIDELASLLSAFLGQAGFSHAGAFTPRDLDYWVLGAFAPRARIPLATWHIGAMFAPAPGGWIVRAVLEGGPAAAAGLRRGDVIVRANGAPFHPFDSFATGRAARLLVRRGGRTFGALAIPRFQGPLESFRMATLASIRHLELDGHRVGVVHMWCCVNLEMRAALQTALLDSLADCEGVVLDLRDGYGGVSSAFADLLTRDPDEDLTVTVIGRHGPLPPPPRHDTPPHPWYRGPLVAIVNEGTRSAKEILAFDLQRSGRATLVGTRTAGAVCALAFAYADAAHRLIVEVPVGELRLNGERVEGVGVPPDRVVPWPLESNLDGDPQLDAALEALRGRLGR